MANSTSANLKLTVQATGENSGTWGQITNTNLLILEQAIGGYDAVGITAAATLTFSNGALSNGKNQVLKLTGTITGNKDVVIPDSIEKTFIVENATSGAHTVTFKTTSGTGVTWSATDKGTKMIYSDGTNVSLGLRKKGYFTPAGDYTAVNGDQLLIDTSGGGIGAPVTITLPASPTVGDEVHFIDSGANLASNNLTVGRNSSNILGSASDLTVSTNAVAFTLVYVNATRGWAYKDNI